MKRLIATKDRMTQIFDAEGRAVPVTVLKVPSVVVTQVKSKEKDGYVAVQLGRKASRERSVRRPQKGHAKNAGVVCDFFREFPLVAGEAAPVVGEKVTVDAFVVGDKITVSGTSKGKGFQGVVKRHRFKGGQRTHGQKHSEREAGSIGGGGRAGGRVARGTRMPGRMGGDLVSVRNLVVAAVDSEGGELYIRGAVPGRRGTTVVVRG